MMIEYSHDDLVEAFRDADSVPLALGSCAPFTAAELAAIQADQLPTNQERTRAEMWLRS